MRVRWGRVSCEARHSLWCACWHLLLLTWACRLECHRARVSPPLASPGVLDALGVGCGVRQARGASAAHFSRGWMRWVRRVGCGRQACACTAHFSRGWMRWVRRVGCGRQACACTAHFSRGWMRAQATHHTLRRPALTPPPSMVQASGHDVTKGVAVLVNLSVRQSVSRLAWVRCQPTPGAAGVTLFTAKYTHAPVAIGGLASARSTHTSKHCLGLLGTRFTCAPLSPTCSLCPSSQLPAGFL
jgi:hypothetical protein